MGRALWTMTCAVVGVALIVGHLALRMRGVKPHPSWWMP